MSCNILVVDDELPNRRLLEALLVPEGYMVSHATNGRQALDRIAAGGIDLVLLDVLMPGISGIETCQRIRNDLGLSLLPVVMVTALADRESRTRGKQAGADDFLTKPVFEDELLVRVRNLLVRHDLFRAAESERAKSEAEAARSNLVSQVATSAVTCRDYGELQSAVKATLAQAMPIHAFVLFETEGEKLRIVTPLPNARAYGAHDSRIRWPSSRWLEALGSQNLIVLDSVADEEPFSAFLAATGASYGTLLPLIVGGEIQGALLLAFQRPLTGAERMLLAQLSPHLANAASNVRSHVKARELSEARDRMAALLVHDFKNPLSVIKANLYVLGDDSLRPEDRLEALEDSERAADRLLNMIVDLMDVSRAEEGSLVLHRERVNVHDLINDVCREFKKLAASRGVDIACGTSPAIFAELDRALFLRVLENIASNAIRYARPGGLIELAAREEDRDVVVEIANDGIPIAGQVRERLFEKYGTSRDASQSPNRGLGLYFCRLVAEGHGGSIAARDRESGKGVVFSLRLPRCVRGPYALAQPHQLQVRRRAVTESVRARA